MSELAGLGTLPEGTAGKSLLAPSRADVWPHNPHLRHSLPRITPNSGNSRRAPSNFSGRSRFTLCRDNPGTCEECDLMSETDSLNTLAKEADDDLLLRYQRFDDAAAYAELDRRYRRRLIAYASQYQGGLLRSMAEDIVQEAFMAFHKNRKTYALKNGVNALFHKIVRDRCKDHQEHIEAQKRDYRLTCSVRESDPDRKADPRRQELKLELDELRAMLTPEQAQAIQLTHFDGHTVESAAELAKVPPTAMRKRAERAVNALKKLATPLLILLAIVGSVADCCDLDVYMNLCTAENDDDEVCREDSGDHDSTKLSRKNLMQWLARPDVAKSCLTLDKVHPNTHTKFKEGALTVSAPSSLDRSWPDREENGKVFHLRASKVASNRSPVPSVILAA